MSMIYYEDDADLNVLIGRVISVIGYQSLGRSIAHNLRDSQLDVIVSGTDEEQVTAQGEGFTVATMANATRQAQIIILTVPDEDMTRIYMSAISPNIRKGHTLMVTSAYNIAFGFIEPPPFIDVGLVAPRTIGDMLRENYETDKGSPTYVAVWQDASSRAWDTVLAVAKALGSLKAGALEINATQEAEINLFIQQAILPAFHHIITRAASLLIKEGYTTEAVLIDLYLSGKFSDYMQQAARSGLLHAIQLTNRTGQYGTYSRLERFKDLKLERLLEVTLEEIRTGQFAREWSEEHADGHPRLSKLLKEQERDDLWELEQQTLDLMDDTF
jgi:ketol-acid reductoisomerase